jgi:hypothetical protein
MEEFDKIKKILASKFERELFDAAMICLKDKTNKLRLNNFAYSIRELSRHFLYSLSPEKNVKNCTWFKIETQDGKPTRAQRIKYAIQGGISDEFLEEWDFDVVELKESIVDIKKIIDNLSKFTHINEDVFDLDTELVDSLSTEILETFKSFVETIENYREDLKSFLDGTIEEHMISSVVSNFFENVDSLAPHHSLNYCVVSDYFISEINDQEITVNVSGNISVTLEYGSRRERSEGDGLDLEEDFPFETKIRYAIEVDFPSNNYEIDEYDADTSDWYGEDE